MINLTAQLSPGSMPPPGTSLSPAASTPPSCCSCWPITPVVIAPRHCAPCTSIMACKPLLMIGRNIASRSVMGWVSSSVSSMFRSRPVPAWNRRPGMPAMPHSRKCSGLGRCCSQVSTARTRPRPCSFVCCAVPDCAGWRPCRQHAPGAGVAGPAPAGGRAGAVARAGQCTGALLDRGSLQRQYHLCPKLPARRGIPCAESSLASGREQSCPQCWAFGRGPGLAGRAGGR